MTPPEEDYIPPLPCTDCVVMAICNAQMRQVESQLGLNAFNLYKKCSLIKDYIDEHYVTQVDDATWRTSLRPIHNFFIKDESGYNPYHKTYVTSDYRL